MMTTKDADSTAERLNIQEKALSNLADSLRKRDAEVSERIEDILVELKALKLFLARNIPEFKQQFPEIQRKLE
jgi:hypothetical protein